MLANSALFLVRFSIAFAQFARFDFTILRSFVHRMRSFVHRMRSFVHRTRLLGFVALHQFARREGQFRV